MSSWTTSLQSWSARLCRHENEMHQPPAPRSPTDADQGTNSSTSPCRCSSASRGAPSRTDGSGSRSSARLRTSAAIVPRPSQTSLANRWSTMCRACRRRDLGLDCCRHSSRGSRCSTRGSGVAAPAASSLSSEHCHHVSLSLTSSNSSSER